MDLTTLFKIQCGLYYIGVEEAGRRNACICNTLMEQSHIPVRLSVTLDKTHLTHDMVLAKKSLCICPLADSIPMELIRRFGFAAGRDKDKFEGLAVKTDCNNNPYPDSPDLAARFSLQVYDTVDMGTHTIFLCTVDEMENMAPKALTYSGYREGMKK